MLSFSKNSLYYRLLQKIYNTMPLSKRKAAFCALAIKQPTITYTLIIAATCLKESLLILRCNAGTLYNISIFSSYLKRQQSIISLHYLLQTYCAPSLTILYVKNLSTLRNSLLCTLLLERLLLAYLR
jgi:hypothetical protein